MMKNKRKMIEEIGMKFDEAVELFSDETLESMTMVSIVGGETNTYCGNAQCVTGCNNHCNGCGGTGGTGSTGSTGGTGGGGTTISPIVQWTIVCGAQIYHCGK